MIVACERCQTRIRVQDPDATNPVVQVRCTLCQHVFSVTSQASQQGMQPQQDPFANTQAGWGFGAPGSSSGSPAFGAPGSQTGLPPASPFGAPGSQAGAPAFGAPRSGSMPAWPAPQPFGAPGSSSGGQAWPAGTPGTQAPQRTRSQANLAPPGWGESSAITAPRKTNAPMPNPFAAAQPQAAFPSTPQASQPPSRSNPAITDPFSAQRQPANPFANATAPFPSTPQATQPPSRSNPSITDPFAPPPAAQTPAQPAAPAAQTWRPAAPSPQQGAWAPPPSTGSNWTVPTPAQSPAPAPVAPPPPPVGDWALDAGIAAPPAPPPAPAPEAVSSALFADPYPGGLGGGTESVDIEMTGTATAAPAAARAGGPPADLFEDISQDDMHVAHEPLTQSPSAALTVARPSPHDAVTAPPPSPPSGATRQPRGPFFRPWMLAAVFLLLVGGGAAAAFTVPYQESTVGMAFVGVLRNASGSGPVGDVDVQALRGVSWHMKDGHKLMVLMGEVTNTTASTVNAVMVRAELRDARGAVIQREEAYAGRALTELDVASLSSENWFSAQKERVRSLAGERLEPGAAWPFTILVLDPPEAAWRGNIQVTGHRADAIRTAAVTTTPAPTVAAAEPPPAPKDPEAEPAPAPPPPDAAALPPPPPRARKGHGRR